jgi:E3 SUMO-protein ligase PIAS1
LKNYSIESLIIDPLFNCITSAVSGKPVFAVCVPGWHIDLCCAFCFLSSANRVAFMTLILSIQMKHMGEDITEVEMKDDGSWRPKLEGEARLQEPWRTPQGSFVIAANGSNHYKPVSWQPPLMPVKVEEGLSSHEQASLKLGMKRMHDGVWAINGFKHPNGWADAGPSKRLKPVANISRSTDVNEEQEDGDRSVNQEASEKAAVYSDDGDEVAFPVKMGDGSTGMWQSTGGDVENGDTDVIVLSDTDEEEAGEDTVLGSSGAPVYMGSDGLGHGTTQSPNIAAEDLHDLHAESPGLALAPDRETGLALSSGSLHFKHLPDTRMDSFTNNEEGLGLQLENSNFWSSQMRNISSGPFGYYGGSDPPSISHHPLPTRPTPVQVAAGMGFSLPSPPPHREDSIRGSSWRRYSQPSHSLPYASAEHNGGGSSDSGRGASPSESALYLFLPPQPARVPVVTHYPLNFVYYVYSFFFPTLAVDSQSYITIWNVKILSVIAFNFVCIFSIYERKLVLCCRSMRCDRAFKVQSAAVEYTASSGMLESSCCFQTDRKSG